MKAMIFVGITIGGLIGGWIGSILDHGNGLGPWSLLLSTVGSLAGIWAAVKFSQ
jgi:uncharacterized protein YcfJ